MANRREILASGAVITAASLLPALTAQAVAAELPGPDIELFVFDKRFDNAVALATQAAARGIALAEASGDLMDLWYDNLDLRWKEAPMTLAGVTSAKVLFVLETLASDHRMLVVHRTGRSELTDTQYAPIGDTEVVSWIIAPAGAAVRA